jgi:UDP-glucose:(heptosyl)LPS alpha-1,3-glucosyltransferase
MAREQQLRVAIVTQDFGYHAGVARDAAVLSRELVGRGVDVHCYCDPAKRSIDVDGVVFHDVRPLRRSSSRVGSSIDYATFAAAATRAVRRARAEYDVVQANESAAWEHDVVRVQAVRRAEQLRWPERGGRGYRFATARARLAPVLRPQIAAARAIERLQYRPGRLRAAAAVTDEVARDLEQVHGLPRELIHVIPCAVEFERFANATPNGVRRRLGVDDAAPLLLFVGHDFERKGLTEAIGALARVDEDAHLLVVGGGDEQPYVREAQRAGVGERVHFLGATEETGSLYASADVFVLPTREDAWGMVLVESMAAGVPVVTTRVAGAAPLVADADAGVVVADGRSPELADAIAGLLADPERRRAAGERGRAAATAFTAGAQAEAFISLYERVGRRA